MNDKALLRTTMGNLAQAILFGQDITKQVDDLVQKQVFKDIHGTLSYMHVGNAHYLNAYIKGMVVQHVKVVQYEDLNSIENNE